MFDKRMRGFTFYVVWWIYPPSALNKIRCVKLDLNCFLKTHRNTLSARSRGSSNNFKREFTMASVKMIKFEAISSFNSLEDESQCEMPWGEFQWDAVEAFTLGCCCFIFFGVTFPVVSLECWLCRRIYGFNMERLISKEWNNWKID